MCFTISLSHPFLLSANSGKALINYIPKKSEETAFADKLTLESVFLFMNYPIKLVSKFDLAA